MITLYKFGPAWGLSDISPFCRKVEVYFQLMNIPYTPKIGTPQKAPKQKLPTVNIDGEIICDSSAIIAHFEAISGTALDAGMSENEAAIACAFQALVEEKLYFIAAWARWADESGWASYRGVIGDYFVKIGVPSFLKSFVLKIARKKVVGSIWTQGTGRHSPDEIYAMGADILQSLSAFLADKQFFMGTQVRSIDASVYALLSGIMDAPIETPLKHSALALPKLVSYCKRMGEELDARSLNVE